jgi:hypothetical protein
MIVVKTAGSVTVTVTVMVRSPVMVMGPVWPEAAR